jgi:hypothetical protein
MHITSERAGPGKSEDTIASFAGLRSWKVPTSKRKTTNPIEETTLQEEAITSTKATPASAPTKEGAY